MSRSNEIPKTDSVSLDNSPVAGERQPQQESGRAAMSREVAHREMDRFRGPAAYTIREISGRRSALQGGNAEVEQ